MGSPTCLLYYSTSPSPPFPGYGVTPNLPYQITAGAGSTVYFYYTYSWPGGGEHTTVDHVVAFEVGNCLPTSLSDEEFAGNNRVSYSPNPVSDVLTLHFPEKGNSVNVYDIRGKLMDSFMVNDTCYNYDMGKYRSGIYFFSITSNKSIQNFKVIKK